MESNEYEHSDMKAVARAELKKLQKSIANASSSDDMTSIHYADLVARIDEIFED